MTATTIRVQMAQRKDTAANWTSANPILLSGEIGYETDTKKFKIGNGSSNWNSLAYLPIPDGSGNLTITGNLEIGSTGSLTFEGSTADGFETTLAVTNPTADRTITLPDRSGTVITSGDTGTVTSTMLADGTIVNADISATAEIAVSKLANGTANQIITTDGTDVSWSSNLNLAGNATIQGDLTVNGTTTTIDTQTLLVEDKNIEMGVVATPTDVTADGGGITLRGTTNKTINWIDSTDSWTSSEHIDLASGKSYRINNTEVLNSTTLGSGVTASSLTSVGTLGSLTVSGSATAASFIPTSSTVPTNGVYLPAANSVAISTNGTGRLFVDASGRLLVGTNVARSVGGSPRLLEIEGVSDSTTDISITRNSADQFPPMLGLVKTRGTAVNTFNLVSSNDELGALRFYGADGSSVVQAAKISAFADATPGLSSMPGRLVFFTTSDGASTPTERLRITSDGKLGLGIANPSTLIHCRGGVSGADSRLTIGNDAAAVQAGVDGSNFAFIGTNQNQPFYFFTNGTERARIDSSGRVGIGTSSPVNTLDVNGGVGVQYATGLRAYRDQYTVNNIILRHQYIGSDDQLQLAPIGDSPTSTIAFRTASSSTLGTRMFISPTGNVGIGTTSPASIIHASGSSGSIGLQVTSGSSSGEIAQSGVDFYVVNKANGPTQFWTNGSERARIDSSGRLLVGTSSDFKSTLFQVRGSATIGYAANDAFSEALFFTKTRATSPGTQTVVQSGDSLGLAIFQGSDGSAYRTAAQIEAVVDGTPGANDMPGRLVFSTTADGASSPTERVRILSTGSALFNTTVTSPHSTGTYGVQISPVDGVMIGSNNSHAVIAARWNGNGEAIRLQRDNATVGTISVTTTATAYNTSSDYRLKENITAVADGITRLQQLKPSRFNFISNPSQTVDGFIAHEVETVVPEAVTGTKDAVDEDGNPIYQGIDQSKLVPLLTAALKEAIGRIETLEAEVAVLKAQ